MMSSSASFNSCLLHVSVNASTSGEESVKWARSSSIFLQRVGTCVEVNEKSGLVERFGYLLDPEAAVRLFNILLSF